MSILQEISGESSFLPGKQAAPSSPRRQEGTHEHFWNRATVHFPQRYLIVLPSQGELSITATQTLFRQITEGLNAEVKELKKRYVFTSNRNVQEFLQNHRSLPHILIDAEPHLKDCFGSDSVLNLEVLIDEDGSRSLYAVVLWRGEAELAESALAKFDDSWWLDKSREASGFLTITYELV